MRARNQAHTRGRDRLDLRVFADLDGGSVREGDFDAAGTRAQAIAGDKRHVRSGRFAFSGAFERCLAGGRPSDRPAGGSCASCASAVEARPEAHAIAVMRNTCRQEGAYKRRVGETWTLERRQG